MMQYNQQDLSPVVLSTSRKEQGDGLILHIVEIVFGDKVAHFAVTDVFTQTLESIVSVWLKAMDFSDKRYCLDNCVSGYVTGTVGEEMELKIPLSMTLSNYISKYPEREVGGVIRIYMTYFSIIPGRG